jgi:hypothetical protein
MKPLLLICILLATSFAASAQDRPQPAPDICKPEVEKLCAAKALKQECLVANWTRLSSPCQDALLKPIRGGD